MASDTPRGAVSRRGWLIGLGLMQVSLAACNFDTGGQGEASSVGGSTSPADSTSTTSATSSGMTTAMTMTGSADGTTSTSTSGSTDGTGDDGSSTGSSTGPAGVCGDQIVEAGEDCDDDDSDETDGCLSTCVVPRSCAHVLEQIPGAGNGTYTLVPDGAPLETWCDMSGDGWTLVAKVNLADEDTPDDAEPTGWFDMTLATDQLLNPDLVLNGPLASHGASRFSTLLRGSSVARFELIAAEEQSTTAHWYKRIASPESFAAWFDDIEDVESEVCTDRAFTINCQMGTISSANSNYTRLMGMDLADHGYSRGDVIHMRLSGDSGAYWTSICSATNDQNNNEWPDSYGAHWGNALRIWLQE